MSRLHRRERGSATVEMVVVAPGLIMIIGLLIMGGRIAIAGGSVEHAAAEAQASGDSTARMVLDNAGLQCVGAASVSIDTADFTTTQAGQPGEVSATVSCQVRLSDVAIPGLPGTRLMEHRASSPLDTYRTRQ
jgi:Flp pilus assembly protein TadG